ncbi:MAG: S1C family serine protease [Candidatus Limnocylindrales bacterium]
MDTDTRSNRSTARLMLAAAILSATVAAASTLAVVTLVPPTTTTPAATTTATTSTTAAASPGAALTSIGTTLDDTAIAAAAAPSVVTITTSAGRATDVGTGIVVTADGLILTNDHVVAGGGALSVQLLDGRTLDATVVAEDADADLAVIRVTASDLTPAQFGDSSSVKVGQSVLAIGSPLGTYTETVTKGIVSGLDREITVRSEFTGRPTQLSHLIQTDAAINPGNNGGPLIDASGKVIGITTATSVTAAGLGFAIPINDAKSIIAQAQGGA